MPNFRIASGLMDFLPIRATTRKSDPMISKVSRSRLARSTRCWRSTRPGRWGCISRSRCGPASLQVPGSCDARCGRLLRNCREGLRAELYSKTAEKEDDIQFLKQRISQLQSPIQVVPLLKLIFAAQLSPVHRQEVTSAFAVTLDRISGTDRITKPPNRPWYQRRSPNGTTRRCSFRRFGRTSCAR